MLAQDLLGHVALMITNALLVVVVVMQEKRLAKNAVRMMIVMLEEIALIMCVVDQGI